MVILFRLENQNVTGIDGKVAVAGVHHLQAAVTLHCLDGISEAQMDGGRLDMGAAHNAEIQPIGEYVYINMCFSSQSFCAM